MLVEKGKTLDHSILWSWIRHYYTHGGLDVWSEGDIPFHITNTPILAAEWAKSILAYCRDFWSSQQIDSTRPIEVFEFGPGTGRHAFYLLRELKRIEPLTRSFCPGGLRFRLHLAELGKKGLDSLSAHENFQEAFADGSLVLHLFDITEDEAPRHYFPPGMTLALPSPNPVFVITNYILDSLPHDVLRVSEQKTSLGHTLLEVKDLKKGQEPTSLKDLGERIVLKFEFPDEPATYPDDGWNEVVRHYSRLGGETHVPFPTSALRLCGRCARWSQSAVVMLVADKSFTTMSQLVELEAPELVPHGGGFSFNANLHALGFLAQRLGGRADHSSSRDGTLDLSHVVFPSPGVDTEGWSFLESEYRLEELDSFHAVDRFRTKESVDDLDPKYSLRLSLDILRLTGFDPQVLYELSDHILEALEHEEENLVEMEEELADMLPRVLPLVYPLPDDTDAAFEVGRIAYRIESYELARKAFLMSLQQYGEDARTFFNLGLIWYYRDSYELAVEEFEKALSLRSDYAEAKKWITKAREKAGALK